MGRREEEKSKGRVEEERGRSVWEEKKKTEERMRKGEECGKESRRKVLDEEKMRRVWDD